MRAMNDRCPATLRPSPAPPLWSARRSGRLTGAPMRFGLFAVFLALAGCHGIQPTPTSPAPPARSSVPARLNLTMSPGELPIGGGSVVVRVETLGADGSGVSTSVALSVSSGELAGDQVRTDSTGHAVTAWQGTKTVKITGTAGEIISSTTVIVREPPVFPPPSDPPTPTPPPPPPPPPPPSVPQPVVSLSASPDRVAVGATTFLTATTANLSAGESVIAYQWIWEGTGTTIDETSIDPTRPHIYSADGIKAPRVTVLTSGGRSAGGSGRVIVYRP